MTSTRIKISKTPGRAGLTSEPTAIKKVREGEQQQRLRRSFFTNLLLLGFDSETQEKEDNISYNENMFLVPNTKGALTVLYFLMQKLDPEEVKTRFRGFWPVFDKKQEQYFRKELCNWLNKIAQEDDESGFNSVVPSLFLSPGGHKFETFLLYLSRYVLLKTLKKQCDLKDGYLRCPKLNSSLSQKALIPNILKCASIKNVQSLLVSIEENLQLYQQWRLTIQKLTEEYSYHSKALNKWNPKRQDQESSEPQQNLNNTDESRKETIDWVTTKWEELHHQIGCLESDKKTVLSFYEDLKSKHKLDVQNLHANIPEQLLQVKEKQIQQGKVDSLYRGGKLDIISLMKLSNLSLEMYQEKLQSAAVCDGEPSIAQFKLLSTNHGKYLNNMETLKQKMTDMLQCSKLSVNKLIERLHDCENDSKSMLVPHSPPRKNVSLMPAQKEILSKTDSIVSCETDINPKEEARKILEAVVTGVKEKTPVNVLAALQKNEDRYDSDMPATDSSSQNTKPSSRCNNEKTPSAPSHAVSSNQVNAAAAANKKHPAKTVMSQAKVPAQSSKLPVKVGYDKAMKDYVCSIVDCYKSDGALDLQDVTEALSLDAFQSKDKLTRSPLGKPNHSVMRPSKDSGIEESKCDFSLVSSPSCAEAVSSLLTPLSASHHSMALIAPSPMTETPTLLTPVTQLNTSSFLDSIKINDFTDPFTTPHKKVPLQSFSESPVPFDVALKDGNVHSETPDISGQLIDHSNCSISLKDELSLMGRTGNWDFLQGTSKFSLLDSLNVGSESRISDLSLSEKPLEDESDSILVD
ncbi:HAUS augmin-like complex subunit 6 [Argonauta hians]